MFDHWRLPPFWLWRECGYTTESIWHTFRMGEAMGKDGKINFKKEFFKLKFTKEYIEYARLQSSYTFCKLYINIHKKSWAIRKWIIQGWNPKAFGDFENACVQWASQCKHGHRLMPVRRHAGGGGNGGASLRNTANTFSMHNTINKNLKFCGRNEFRIEWMESM